MHPLFRPVETPAKMLEHPEPAAFESRATLFLSLHLDATGRVVEGAPVEPPLAQLAQAVTPLLAKWRFTPARRAGAIVATWATYGVDLSVSLEKPTFVTFNFVPVGKEDPLPVVTRESVGDAWLTRYPKEIAPADPGAFSIEDVDTLPVPEKSSWSFSSARIRSRVTALVEVTELGTVRRIVPTGTAEPLLIAWLRQATPRWKLSPATEKGKPVSSWMVLDATLEYTVDSAKEKGKRSLKKNLRGVPAE